MSLPESQLRVLRAAKARKLYCFRFSPDGSWLIYGEKKPSPATVRSLRNKELLRTYPDGGRLYAIPTDAGRAELDAADAAHGAA